MLVGQALDDPRAFGVDAVFPAFFLALLANEVREPRNLRGAMAAEP